MKRIALFMHGGVAPPGSTKDVPAIAGLVKRMSEQFDITVYVSTEPDGYGGPFPCGKATVKFVRRRQNDSRLTRVLRTLYEFRMDHRAHSYSLVHGFWALPGGLAAVLAGKLSGLPSIVSILGGEAAHLPAIRYGNMLTFPSRSATLWTCSHASALTVLTRYQLDSLRRFEFKRTDGIHTIPFGAEDSLFHDAGKKPTPPPHNLLHIGHLNRVKDQHTLLGAFREISQRVDCRLRIIGEDTLNGAVHQRAGELGISNLVRFTGFVPHDELHHHFAWAHILLHSSLYEGQGVVFSEAAASGIPICGTRVGLLSDLGDLLAVTSEPGDQNALAQGVLDLLGDAARMERLRKQARRWAVEHSADWTATRFTELYNQYLRA